MFIYLLNSFVFCQTLQVSFEGKKDDLFEMVIPCPLKLLLFGCLGDLFHDCLLLQVSIPAWFTVDTRLGSLSVHLDTPQCFTAEMYSADLNIVGKPEDDKVNSFIISTSPLNFFFFGYFPYIIVPCHLLH